MEEDRISGMPDEVLVSILSLVTMKEAASTSVLSRRWRKPWTFIPNLNFDRKQKLYDLRELRFSLGCLERSSRGQREYFRERTNYVKWVNRVLELYQGTAIDQFRVCFDLDESYSRDIDNWINFVMVKRVQRLELRLPTIHIGSQLKPYAFPPLHSQNRDFPICNFLRALKLDSVNVTGEVLEYFICNCPFLERLCVKHSDTLVNLKVAGPSLRLKYLEISYCFKLENLEISATDLVSFKYFGPRITMPLNYAPNLVEVNIGGQYCEYVIYDFQEFSSYFSQLETLTLNVGIIKEKIKFLEFPILSNLKQLELRVFASDNASNNASLLALTSLIKAAPVLCRFALKLNSCDPYDFDGIQVLKAPKCTHHCLKVVEVVGFVGRIIDVEFVIYLIENAIALEKVIVDPRCPLAIGKPWEYENLKQIRAARKRAKLLKTKLSLGDKLVIL